MGYFIRSLSRFAVCFLVVMLAMVALSVLLIRLPRVSIPAGKHILVVGDSHTECAIDDSVFAVSANFSKAANAFIYAYATIKKLVADNPQIDTVLLSFQFGSLTYEQNGRWILRDQALFEKVPVYLPFLDAGDVAVFLRTPFFYNALAQTPRVCANYYYRLAIGEGVTWQQENIGHYLALSFNSLKNNLAVVTPYKELAKKDTVSLDQVEYLRKIAGFCRGKGIMLVLINTPVYQPEKYEGYRAFEINKEKYLRDLLLLDYSHFPIPDSCYCDINHLNANGARIFSAYLRDRFAVDVKKLMR